jgi:hypothetical protein
VAAGGTLLPTVAAGGAAALPGEGLMIGRPIPRAARLLKLEGVFDVSAAQRVARALAEGDADEPVHLDLTHVREFHDFGVAFLAQVLAVRPRHVAVRGLRQHHLRLLRYLHIDTAGVDLGPESGAA